MQSEHISTEIIPVELEDGTKIYIEVLMAGGEENVGWNVGKIKFDWISKTLSSISASLMGAIQKVKPTKAQIEFQLAVGVESGELTAIWVKGEGKGHIKVSLEWEEEKPPSGSAEKSK